MKTCFKCKETKPITSFYVHPAMGDGRLNKCKECAKRDVRAYYEANRDQYRAYEQQRAQLPHRVEARRNYSQTQAGKQAHQRANSKYLSQNPERKYAHYAVSNAIRDGKLTRPAACERCGIESHIEGHHEDYSKPLDVTWLCRGCHVKRHRELREAAA